MMVQVHGLLSPTWGGLNPSNELPALGYYQPWSLQALGEEASWKSSLCCSEKYIHQ